MNEGGELVLENFRVVFECTAVSEAAFTEAAIAHLSARGYSVSTPNDNWETPGEFCARTKIALQHFREHLLHPNAPQILTHRGPTNRVRLLLSTPAFDAFCRRNKK